MLISDITMVQLSKHEINIGTAPLTQQHTLLELPQCFHGLISVPGPWTPHCIYCQISRVSSNLRISLSFVSFMTFRLLKNTAQLFCRMPLDLDLSVFSWLDWSFGWWIFWLQHINILLVALILISWLRWCLPGLSTAVSIVLLSVLHLHSEALNSAHIQGEGLEGPSP